MIRLAVSVSGRAPFEGESRPRADVARPPARSKGVVVRLGRNPGANGPRVVSGEDYPEASPLTWACAALLCILLH